MSRSPQFRVQRWRRLILAAGYVLAIMSVPACARGGSRGAVSPRGLDPQMEEQLSRTWKGPKDHRWKAFDALVGDQKYQEAQAIADAILAEAQQASRIPEWTRALVRATAVRVALHQFETAVRFLMESPWPQDPVAQAVLGLYQAWTLQRYLDAYGWEIRQRERVETSDALDLKSWSIERVHQAILEGFGLAFQQREALGRLPTRAWVEFLEVNTYPADLRPTLRDAVSYLYGATLADSSLWSPRQANEVFLLDLEALTGEASRVPAPSGEVHPLGRMAAVLADLETWHRSKDRREAALEAFLERLRLLRGHFEQPEDRRLLERALDRRATEDRELPWSAQALALQVEWLQDREDPMARRQARDLARDCAARWPDTPGGLRCAWWGRQLERPVLSLSGMAVDGPGRRSLQVLHANLARIHLRAWSIDAPALLEAMEDASWLPSSDQVEQWIASRPPEYQWTQDLPETPDLREHQTFVVPPMAGPGFFLVVASSDPSFGPESLRSALVISIGDLVVRHHTEGDRIEVEVLRGENGAPVPGAEVRLVQRNWREPPRLVHEERTGPDGRVHLPMLPDPQQYRRYGLIMVREGREFAVASLGLRQRPAREEPVRTSALLYTDRSTYRPGQEVLFKVVVWQGRDGTYRTLSGHTVTVSLQDANRQVVQSLSLKTNPHGTASGRLSIPHGRLLGSWSLQTDLGGQTRIQVEEYKRPSFEVILRDPTTPLRLNQPAELTGEVRYFFGLPVTSGRVAWKVTREPQWPTWTWGWWRPPVSARPEVVAAGVAALDQQGTFRVAFIPKADERLARGGQAPTWRYRLVADVTDEGGETRTGERTFRLGFCGVEARIQGPEGFLQAGDAPAIPVLRQDLDGFPAAGEGSWRLIRLAAPARAQLPSEIPVRLPDREGAVHTPGDLERPRWEGSYDPFEVLSGWEASEEVARDRVRHDAQGRGLLVLPPLREGAWRIVYRTEDPSGSPFETSRDFLVAGDGQTPIPLAAVLLAERSSVPVNGRVRLLVHSGFPGQRLVLERWRQGRRVDRTEWEAGPAPRMVEIPVRQEDRGGFSVSLTLVRDYQQVRLTQDILVPWEDRMLQVDFLTFRDRIRPGNRETLTIRVRSRGKDAAVAAAEVLAYMYDRSLDLFAPHVPPDPLGLYPRKTGVPFVETTLRTAPEIWLRRTQEPLDPGFPTFEPDMLRFLEAWGIGGPGMRRYEGQGIRGKLGMAMAPSEVTQAAGASRQGPDTTLSEERKASEAPSGESNEAPAVASQESPTPRSDFRETAFFEPHLLTGRDGTVSLSFQVPDSVTSWRVFAHALTRDLRAGFASSETRSIKDLVVRPYLPRFFREGDRATLQVLVNNASDQALSGVLELEVLDPRTGASRNEDFGLGSRPVRRSFAVASGQETSLSFDLQVPLSPGEVAVRVTASAGNLSDGEVRPLPILPSRLHLTQSRFVALRDAGTRTMAFPDLLQDDDPTRTTEQIVVTGDAQLFYAVLEALPYLVNYPYECSEQTLNRFLSTGILASLFDQYPEVSRMAASLASRESRLETFDAPNPNQRMAMEETPWLMESRGGPENPSDLLRVLDPAVARAQRDAALARLRKVQTASGGFPWFPGGPPSPYMTLYVVHGLSRAVEFGIEVPMDLVARAFQYLHRHYLDEVVREMRTRDVGWEYTTFLAFLLSCFPDRSWTGGVFSENDLAAMGDFGLRHWKEHSPYLKGLLALLLHRLGRSDDARKVWASVMDSARTDPDLGTWWAPEDRAWLWYNDTIETHAFALRTTMELAPKDPRLEGLVQWLFLNKKGNHWKSTRATAEVLYSLARYLRATRRLGVREDLRIDLGGHQTVLVFEPGQYTGKRQQVVLPGQQVVPARDGTIRVSSTTPGFKFASATWHYATDRLPEDSRGDFLSVERTWYRRETVGAETVLRPLGPEDTLSVGDELEVHLSLRAKHAMEYLHLRDPRAAGLEPVQQTSRYRWEGGLGFYEEVRDSGQNFFLEWMPAGEYRLKYRLRATMAGTFRVHPATLQSMYAPEFHAFSAGALLRILPRAP